MRLIDNKILDPKNDYVFKRIFGHIGNEEITKDLLSAILGREITSVELDNNPILEKDLSDSKVGVLDIKAKIDKKIDCDIEMQIVDKNNMEDRLLYYWSSMYYNTVKSGEDYLKSRKVIIILISNYNLKSTEKINSYISKWKISNDKNVNISLTDKLEFYILELPKFEKYKDKENNFQIEKWVNFIKNPEDDKMNENDEAIKKARKVLNDISQDKYEREMAELRLKYIMEMKSQEQYGYDKGVEFGIGQGLEQGFKKGIEQGIEQGIKKGVEQGIEHGITKNKIETAKKMKSQNLDITLIVSITGLTKEEIEKL